MRFDVPRAKVPMYAGVVTLMLSFVLRLFSGMDTPVQLAAVQALGPAVGVYLGARIGVWYFYQKQGGTG